MADQHNIHEQQQPLDDDIDQLDNHEQCFLQCRSSIILQYIEQYPDSLSMADDKGHLPLHRVLLNEAASIDITLLLIEKYPAALQHRNHDGDRPLHIECWHQCRSAIISKCIELYPEALSEVTGGGSGNLPLHSLLFDESSSVDDAFMMIDKYPAGLRHQNSYGYLPTHVESMTQCRSAIITKCIEQYPEAVAQSDNDGNFLLHRMLRNESSSVDDIMMVIEKYPGALKRPDNFGYLPLHVECRIQFRTSLLLKCFELYPDSLDDITIAFIIMKVDKLNFSSFYVMLSTIFTARPMSLYDRRAPIPHDIRKDPYYRRRILNLLPGHVFTKKLESDYRDLNWKPRAAMMMLLSQMKNHTRQQQQRTLFLTEISSEALARTISSRNWHYQRGLLLYRIIKKSTVSSDFDSDVKGKSARNNVKYGICQHEDLGDILLRSIFRFL
jgi:ankyrin repeat protein